MRDLGRGSLTFCRANSWPWLHSEGCTVVIYIASVQHSNCSSESAKIPVSNSKLSSISKLMVLLIMQANMHRWVIIPVTPSYTHEDRLTQARHFIDNVWLVSVGPQWVRSGGWGPTWTPIGTLLLHVLYSVTATERECTIIICDRPQEQQPYSAGNYNLWTSAPANLKSLAWVVMEK